MSKVFKVARRWPRLISRTGNYYRLAIQTTERTKNVDYDGWQSSWEDIERVRLQMARREINDQLARKQYGQVISNRLAVILSNQTSNDLPDDVCQIISDFDFLENSDL